MRRVTSRRHRRHVLVYLFTVLVVGYGLPASAASPSGSSTPSSSPRPRPAQTLHGGNPIELQFTATVGTVVSSKSALNTLGYGLSSPTSISVCTNCGGGEVATLINGTAGLALVFYLNDASCSQTFSSTDPSHARVTQDSAAQWTIAWDDAGGGCSPDGDFNDMITKVVLFGPGISSEQTYGSGSGTHAANPTWSYIEPVNTLTGNYYTSVTDLRLRGIGIPFALTRSYNSADPTVGPLGPGWTYSYNVWLDISGGDMTLRAEDGQRVGFALQPDGSYLGDPGVRDTLVQNTDGTYTLTRRDQTAYAFDSSGKLTTLTDRNGEGLAFSYTSGLLTQITDSAGRQIGLTYNNTGTRLKKVQLPDLRRVTYVYTGDLLTSVTDVNGNSTTYGYDASNRLISVTDQNGNTAVTNVYGADGRITAQTDGRGNISTLDWDPDTQTSTFTDARGNAWTDVYLDGALIERIDPLGNTTFFGYDPQANFASTTDPDGNITTYAYDPSGNLLTKTDPLGNETTYTYDGKNDLTSTTDPLGNETDFGYDAAGNLTSMIQPGGIETDYGRDPSGTGLLNSTTDPNGNVTTYAYDSVGNLTSITDPLGNQTTMAYDPSGRMTSQVAPRGNVSGANPVNFTADFTYDDADRVLTQNDPLNQATTFTYDPVGNLATVTDANSRTTTYGYDENNNLVSVQAPDGATTTYGYDETNNLVSKTDDNGNTWTYAYDQANRLELATSPLGEVASFAYDPMGNLITKTLPSSDTIGYGYDQDNRLTSIDYSGTATPDLGLAYDAAGNRTQMTDGAGTAGYTYDDLNRLTEVTRGSDTFSYAYDDAGNLTSRVYPDATLIDYGYDSANELTSVATGGTTTSYAYDPDGNLATASLPANTITYTWDRADRLTKVSNKKGASTISVFNPTLDPVGNPTQVVTKTETITYAYDAQNRLTQVCYLPGCSGSGLAGISYNYDGVGNRLSESRYGSSPTTTYSAYNADDKLCWTATSSGTCASPPVGATTYSFDQNGNQTAAGPRTFTYDLENRLTSTTLSGSTESYTYDGDGNRLTLSDGGTLQTSYLWDTNAPLPELAIERDGSGALLRRYVYGRALLSMTAGGSAHYFLADGLGSIANVTSSSGNAEWTYTYEPFGSIRSATSGSGAPTNLMRFAGQLFDATTGVYDLRARMYDPTTGRFAQRDPLQQPLQDPLTASYLYAAGRPTVLIDPSGRAGTLPDCSVIEGASVEQYLSGQACIPDYFPYSPQYFNGPTGGLLGDPYGDGCSGGALLSWVPPYQAGCLVHDFGYDLIRAGVIPDTLENKVAIDAFFYKQEKAYCAAAFGNFIGELTGLAQVCYEQASASFVGVLGGGWPNSGGNVDVPGGASQ